MHPRRLLLFALVLAFALVGQPAAAAEPQSPLNGLFLASDPATGWQAVMDLRFLPDGVVIAILLQPTGGYRAFLGGIDRGGLNIRYATLREIADPLRFLIELDPAEPKQDRSARLFREGRVLDTSCQFYLFTGPDQYDFTCSNRQGSSSGRLTRIL